MHVESRTIFLTFSGKGGAVRNNTKKDRGHRIHMLESQWSSEEELLSVTFDLQNQKKYKGEIVVIQGDYTRFLGSRAAQQMNLVTV